MVEGVNAGQIVTSEPTRSGSMFQGIDPPLYLLTAKSGERESGLIASWVMSVTLDDDKPRVVIALSPGSMTSELIEASGRFILHLLAKGQEALVPHFGLGSGHDHDKLAGIDCARSDAGLAVVRGCAGFAECEVVGRLVVADREVLVCGVLEEQCVEGREPLTMAAALDTLPGEVADAITAKRAGDGERDAELKLSGGLH